MSDLHRNTYLEINLKNIKENVEKIKKKYDNYKYYFAVVKADAYGHGEVETARACIDGGCNYLAVATLDEALNIRKEIKDIPILCLGVIPSKYIKICKEQNITITISSLDYAKELVSGLTKANALDNIKLTEKCEKGCNINGLKAHLKVNTGMNRLGISNQEELEQAIEIIKEQGIVLEGIFTHIYEAENKRNYNKQIEKFEELVLNIDLSAIPIVHVSASEALVNYKKLDFVNGTRLGIIIYGFTDKKELNLQSTFRVCSEVIQINDLENGDIVGYNGLYKANENEKIAVVPIGYADGIIRKNTGRDVFINNTRYPIVGNICMDMLFVKVDDTVRLHDKVELLKDINHIIEVSNHLETIPYEILCSISKRVNRIYIRD